jgi:hypothetical protein
MFVRSSYIHICVCVDIRFRFVAVWNEAESQDCNDPEWLKECLLPLQGLRNKEVTDGAFIKEELDRRCL